MIRTIISDFSKTLIFSKDFVTHLELNAIHRKKIADLKNKNVYALTNEDLILKERLYSVADTFILNYPLLNLYKKLKAQNINLMIFTAGFIHTHPDLKPDLTIFDQIISIQDLVCYSKKDPEAYKKIVSKYGLNGSETIFIDNEEECLSAAREETFKTILFPEIKAYTREQLSEELNKAAIQVGNEIGKLMS